MKVKGILIGATTLVIALTVIICVMANNGVFNPLEHNLNLGYKYLKEGNYQEAIINFNKVIEIDENNTEARVKLFEIYDVLGRYDEARDIIEELIIIDSDNKESYMSMLRDMNKKISPTEAQLTETLLNNDVGSIIWKRTDDYDNDGMNEMFAFVQHGFSAESPYVDLWYVNNKLIRQMTDKKAFYFDPSVTEVDGVKILYIEEGYGGSASTTHAWIVKHGEAIELEHAGSELTYAGGSDFYITGHLFDSTADGTGHTYKRYYLYFDGNEFKEYGGVKVSEEQLRRLSGVAEVLDNVIASGFTIGDIFYRGNNIINVNCTDGWENENITFKLENGTAQVLYNSNYASDWRASSYGGLYEAAHYPEIATYPKTIPF